LSIEASESSIWVGYDGDGLVRYDFLGGSWKPTAFLDNERNDYPQVVTSMQSNRDGTFGWEHLMMDCFKLDRTVRFVKEYGLYRFQFRIEQQ
jgi:hypothetical protein